MVEVSDPTGVKALVERSRSVLDALPRAVTIVDRNAVIVGWNAVSEHLYGWTAAEAMGRVLYDLIVPPELHQTSAEIMRRVLGGERWSGRINALNSVGEPLVTTSFLTPLRDADGAIVGAVGAADDAADLRVLEQRTSDLADHLLLALSAGQLGTWRWDKASGHTIWDAGMERLFGLEPGSFDGTYDAWVALLHPDDAQHSLGVLDRAVETDSAYFTEHRIIWPDGSVHWVSGRGKTITDEHGTVLGTIGCSIDITDRKRAEVEAERRARAAEAAASRERLERERLEFLATINDVARNAIDHVDLMGAVAAAAVPRLGDWCGVHYQPVPGVAPERALAHVDPGKQEWAKTFNDQFPMNPDSPVGVAAVMRTGRTQFVPRVSAAGLGRALESLRPHDAPAIMPIIDLLHLTSVITVPLVSKRGIVGAMQFVSAESERAYDDTDVALAEAAAGRVAEALDNVWLVEQQRNIAQTLQAALLPASLPVVPGATIAVRYWAAGAVAEVGGDFYDVLPIGENSWAIVIGDVCGTGPTAAAVTATARHTIRAAATHGATPTQVLNWVNDAILANGGGLFCTVLYSTLDRRADGSWLYTSIAGGHPLPMLVERNTSSGATSSGATSSGAAPRVRHLGRYGTLIGVMPSITVHPFATVLEPGATIVVHTDGVNDVRPPYAMDDDALTTMVAAAADVDGPADAVAERLGAAIAGILSIPERDDDVAIVVLRID